MLMSYDPKSDALHIELGTTTPVDIQEISAGMSIYLDDKGSLIGVEILDATKRLGQEALDQLVVEGLRTLVQPGEPETEYQVVTAEKASSSG